MNTQKENPMRRVFIEKVVISVGALAEALEKAAKLLEVISGKKSIKTKARKRIPTWGIRPTLQVGAKVTLRGGEANKILKRLLVAVDKTLKRSQIEDNHFSFGIPEYIEIPDIEYQREIGMRGLNVTVDFARAGLKVMRKKIKKGRVPRKQRVSKQEIMEYIEKNFGVELK